MSAKSTEPDLGHEFHLSSYEIALFLRRSRVIVAMVFPREGGGDLFLTHQTWPEIQTLGST